MGQKLHDVGFGNDFGNDTKAEMTKRKAREIRLHKTEEVCAPADTNSAKGSPWNGENIPLGVWSPFYRKFASSMMLSELEC